MTSSTRPLKVLWVLHAMIGGGAERAVATLLAHLARQRIQPYVCLFRKEGVFLKEVPQEIPVLGLHIQHRLDPRLILRLRKVIRNVQPDITIAVMRFCGIVTTLARLMAGQSGPLVVNEQNYPSQEMQWHGGYGFKRWVMRHIYQHAAQILAISQGIREDLVAHFGIPQHHITVIPNPVADDRIQVLANAPPPHPWLAEQRPVMVSVARLHPQKGHDLLLRAFARLRSAVPEARLILVGEGAQRPFLQREATDLGIAGEVAFVGFQENPYAYMRYATVFVLASRYEGFGVALAEALTLGVPTVATDCPGGPKDVLDGGRAGILVPPDNIDALAQALRRVIKDTTLGQRLRIRGCQHAQQYAARCIAEAYTTFLERLAMP